MKHKIRRKIKQVNVSGTAYEMGRQYGSTCPEINKSFEIAQNISGMEYQSALKVTEEFIPFIQEYSPDIMSEIKGIAEGANVDIRQIIFINIWYELGLRGFMACTSFAACGGATHNGELIIGQNLDMSPVLEESLIILKLRPTEGPVVLALTVAGMLGLISINSSGLALSGNFLSHRKYMGLAAGIPHMVWVRKAQASKNIGRAIAAIGSAKRSGCAVNTLLASQEKDIVDIEVTPDDLGIIYPQRDYITHGNHFCTERFKKYDEINKIYPDSIIRSNRLSSLMDKHWGLISVDIMKELLCDHNNFPEAICRHPASDIPPQFLMKTVASIISYPKEQKMYIAYGNPCENEHLEYTLLENIKSNRQDII